MTNDQIAAFVIDQFESGTYTDDPVDAGGATRWGITLRYLATARRVPPSSLTRDDIRTLTRAEAIAALVEVTIMQSGLWQIADWRLRLVVVDFCFNAGEDDGIPALQRAAGVAPDGVIGPATLAAVASVDAVAATAHVLIERARFHVLRSGRGRICPTCKLPSQKKWIGGWINRVATLASVCIEQHADPARAA